MAQEFYLLYSKSKVKVEKSHDVITIHGKQLRLLKAKDLTQEEIAEQNQEYDIFYNVRKKQSFWLKLLCGTRAFMDCSPYIAIIAYLIVFTYPTALGSEKIAIAFSLYSILVAFLEYLVNKFYWFSMHEDSISVALFTIVIVLIFVNFPKNTANWLNIIAIILLIISLISKAKKRFSLQVEVYEKKAFEQELIKKESVNN